MSLDVAAQVLAALAAHDVRYIVFGAIALNLHGLSRATEDLDIFIEATEENVRRLQEALIDVFADESVREISASDLAGDYPAVQYVPPFGSFHMDILSRLGEVYRYEDLPIETILFRDIAVPVVPMRTLYEMKRGTVRPKDWGDAERLRVRLEEEGD